MFIDVHCHLDLLPDIAGAVRRAREAGVRLLITQAVNGATLSRSIELSREYKEVKAALGLYPIDALKLTDAEIDTVIKTIRQHKADTLAIGEIGMDFKEDLDNWERQRTIFRKFIALAQELDVPVIVHSRKAEEACIEELESMGAKKVIMHCFSGKLKLVTHIIENGWSLSIPTSVKNSEHFQKVIDMTPITQLFGETDAPYLHPDRAFPNEPSQVIVSYEHIAKIKGRNIEETEKQIEENFTRLFKKR